MSKPHKAIINIQIDINDILPTGECSGKVVSDKNLKEKDIKTSYLVYIDGSSLEQCLENVKQWIQKTIQT